MTRLIPIGDATGLILSPEILQAAGLACGDDVVIEAYRDYVMVSKTHSVATGVQRIADESPDRPDQCPPKWLAVTIEFK